MGGGVVRGAQGGGNLVREGVKEGWSDAAKLEEEQDVV